MFTAIKQKIEEKRCSRNIFWMTIVYIKDCVWKITDSHPILETQVIIDKLFPNFYPGKLPDFLIIGAQKSGSTYLWKMLKYHPQIEMSPNLVDNHNEYHYGKEVGFFTKMPTFRKGLKWYKSLFNNNGKLQGEATPEYIYAKERHKKMHHILPNAKLILLLRNPSDRAYSAFNHMKQINRTWGEYRLDKSFYENIQIDIKRKFVKSKMIQMGFYIDQIKSILKYYPRNQILILVTEQMKEHPEIIYDKVCNFLGVTIFHPYLQERVHEREYEKTMSDAERLLLQETYEPYNKKLYEFLGFEILEWK